MAKEALDQVLQAEMERFLGAAPGERETRTGYRAGYYSRGLITRIGKIELRVPRDRSGEVSSARCDRINRHRLHAQGIARMRPCDVLIRNAPS